MLWNVKHNGTCFVKSDSAVASSSILVLFFFLHLAYYKSLKEQTACRYTNCHTIMNNLLFSPLFISNQP